MRSFAKDKKRYDNCKQASIDWDQLDIIQKAMTGNSDLQHKCPGPLSPVALTERAPQDSNFNYTCVKRPKSAPTSCQISFDRNGERKCSKKDNWGSIKSLENYVAALNTGVLSSGNLNANFGAIDLVRQCNFYTNKQALEVEKISKSKAAISLLKSMDLNNKKNCLETEGIFSPTGTAAKNSSEVPSESKSF